MRLDIGAWPESGPVRYVICNVRQGVSTKDAVLASVGYRSTQHNTIFARSFAQSPDLLPHSGAVKAEPETDSRTIPRP